MLILSKTLHVIAALVLLTLALTLVGMAAWDVVSAALAGEHVVRHVLDSIGLVIIGIAVYDVGKFLIEEEVLHERELRSSGEARRSLTKFITIIIIATSLHALVLIFEAGEERVQDVIYPVALLLAAVFALIGLSLFQWLSRASEEPAKTSRLIGSISDRGES